MFFIVQEFSHVQIPVFINLYSWSKPFVVSKFAFVQFAFFGYIYSPAHFFLFADLAEINFPCGFDELELVGKEKRLDFEEVIIGEELVGGEEVAKLFFIEGPDFTEKSFFFGCVETVHFKVKVVFLELFGIGFFIEG